MLITITNPESSLNKTSKHLQKSPLHRRIHEITKRLTKSDCSNRGTLGRFTISWKRRFLRGSTIESLAQAAHMCMQEEEIRDRYSRLRPFRVSRRGSPRVTSSVLTGPTDCPHR